MCTRRVNIFCKLSGRRSHPVVHCITLCSCTGVTGQMMSDVLFFVSCIEIIVCMFALQ